MFLHIKHLGKSKGEVNETVIVLFPPATAWLHVRKKICQDTSKYWNVEHMNKVVDFFPLYFSNSKNPYAVENTCSTWHLLKEGT